MSLSTYLYYDFMLTVFIYFILIGILSLLTTLLLLLISFDKIESTYAHGRDNLLWTI